MIPDKLEKHIVLHAPLDRVWDAIADSQKFGAWFGVAFDMPFVAGTHLKGRIAPTRVDPESQSFNRRTKARRSTST